MVRFREEMAAVIVRHIRRVGLWLAVWFSALIIAPTSFAQDYKLGAGDVIRVTVFGHADLATVVRINETGRSNLPLIGDVQLGGKSTAQAEAEIARKLDEGGFVRQPMVTVNVDQFGSQQVAVLGMVAKPGQYVIERETTVVDMVAKAGGLSVDANDIISIIKMRDGRPTSTQLDFVAMLQSGDLKSNARVGSGDVIFAPRADVFYVYGEIQKPGRYRLERDMTLMQALAVGGGITPKGSERHIKINRKNAKGEINTVDGKASEKLQADDVIYVESSLF